MTLYVNLNYDQRIFFSQFRLVDLQMKMVSEIKINFTWILIIYLLFLFVLISHFQFYVYLFQKLYLIIKHDNVLKNTKSAI